MLQRTWFWISDRLDLNLLLDFLRRKQVPRHRYSFWYLFGGLTLFFLLVQVVSGLLLMLYYSPTPEAAYESVQHIVNKVHFGWLVRSIHHWSSHLMVATLLIHLASTYFMKAYRKPRELLWMTGVLLLVLVLAFCFSGYLLPWDTTAYFATQIGAEIPRSIPIIGEFISRLVRGDDYLSGEALKRLFALHVSVLPILAMLILGVHLVLNQRKGSSVPIGIQPRKPPIQFFPNYLLRDVMGWTLAGGLLMTLVLVFPPSLGTKADPYGAAPVGIKPEWYFLPLYQTLRIIPPFIFGLSGEMLANVGVGLFFLLLFLVPLLDRRAALEERGWLGTFIGVCALLYFITTTYFAYLH